MKVLAINSSPRVGNGSKTEILLNSLVNGMKDDDIDIEIINLANKKINYCKGCFSCWTKTPGKCIQKDDMTNEIISKFLDCKICILATPIYTFTLSSILKTFIERLTPIYQPTFKKFDNMHANIKRFRFPRIVVLSVSALPDKHIFDGLSSYMKLMCSEYLIGEIYLPSAEFVCLSSYKSVILPMVEEAGRELIKTRKISKDTTEKILQPLFTNEECITMTNAIWNDCIQKGKNFIECQDDFKEF